MLLLVSLTWLVWGYKMGTRLGSAATTEIVFAVLSL